MKTMEVHDLAKHFPPLEGEEFDLLVDDIKQNGLLEPITLHEEKILDGFNRYRACLIAEVDPRYENFNGGDPLAFVISSNVRRRHLTTSQRAVLALELLPEIEAASAERKKAGTFCSKDQKGDSRDIAGRMLGVSGASVWRAKRIQKETPHRLDEIRDGKTSVTQVEHEIRKDKAKQRAKENIQKKETAKRQERTQEVKRYLDSIKSFQKELDEAWGVAQYGKFSSEAARFTIQRHNRLRKDLDTMDEMLEVIANA